jgi:hypothetical protein
MKLLICKVCTLLSDSSLNLPRLVPMVNASPGLIWSFFSLAIAIAAAFVVAVHASGGHTTRSSARRDTLLAALATATWLAVTLALAASGRLSFTSRPPTAGVLIAVGVGLAIAVGTSRLGARLATGIPLAALIGVQAFRFPLELMLHRAYREGLMPVQMSYSGFNFDILTGLSAIVVALYIARRPNAVAVARIWNAAGIVLLANILTIAVLSTPTPIRVFHNEPANEWIAHAPWVWLPAVFVVAAIVGHIVIFRRLRYESRARERAPRAAAAPSAAAS